MTNTDGAGPRGARAHPNGIGDRDDQYRLPGLSASTPLRVSTSALSKSLVRAIVT